MGKKSEKNSSISILQATAIVDLEDVWDDLDGKAQNYWKSQRKSNKSKSGVKKFKLHDKDDK